MASLVSRPNGHFWVQITIGPARKTIRLGKLPRRSAEEFRRKIETINALRIAGLPYDEATASWLTRLDPVMSARLETCGLIEKRPAQTITEMLLHVFKNLAVKKSTRTSYENVRRNLLEFFGPNRKIATITPGDCEEFSKWLATHNEVRKDGVMSKATVVGRTRRARQFFNTAVKKRWIPTNPFHEIRIVGNQVNESRMHYVPLEHIEALMQEMPDNEYRLILGMARFAGMRTPSEPMAIKWEHVDWSKGTIAIHSPKTGVRVCPIFSELRPYLERQWDAADESPWVISRHRITGQALTSVVVRALNRLGIEVWPRLFQNCRSSAETDLLTRFPVFTVCRWLGNSPKVVQRHYAQVTQQSIDEACGKPVGKTIVPTQPATEASQL